MRLPLEFEGRERRHGIVFLSQWSGPPRRGGVEAASRRGNRHGAQYVAGCLAAGGLPGLKERFGPAGVFLEIFWRFPKNLVVSMSWGAANDLHHPCTTPVHVPVHICR
jgi:hypothetical protein